MADDRPKSKIKSAIKSKKSKIKTKNKEKDKDKDKDKEKVKDKEKIKDKDKENVSSKRKKSSPDALAKDRKVTESSNHLKAPESSRDNRISKQFSRKSIKNSKESIQSKATIKNVGVAKNDKVERPTGKSKPHKDSDKNHVKKPPKIEKIDKGQKVSRPSTSHQVQRPPAHSQPQPHRPRQAQAIGASPDMSDINKAFAEVKGAKPIKTTTAEQRKIMASVIRLQWTDGHFMLSPNLAVLFGHDYNTLKKDATEYEFIGNAYATQLAVSFIDNRLTDVKSEMQKEYDKAVSWLVTNYPDQVHKLKSVADTYYPRPKERHHRHKK